MSKYIIILFVLYSPQWSQNTDFDMFITNLTKELVSYQEVSDVNEIPKKLFKEINNWKKEQYFLKFGEKVEKEDMNRFSFSLAGKNEPYNATCFTQKGLPFRQFQFAGQYEEKWIISYLHGQGRTHNNKLLIIDMKHPDKISVMYVWSKDKYLESLSELGIFLENLQSNPQLTGNSCYLLNSISCGRSNGLLSF